jgi:hypothetical protein
MPNLREAIPALRYGWKLGANDIAGMIGLPYVGNVYYVDPYVGSDSANSGTSQDDALATVSAAYDKCVSGHQDVVIIAPTGGTGRTTEATPITWAKRFTHLIGSAAPTMNSPRAGMSFTKAAATTTPQFTLSENGCIFKNVVFYQGVADSYGGFEITGDYNSFQGVHFNGGVNATAGDSANCRSLILTGASDNVFDSCVIGNDTTARSAAGNSLEIKTGSARNEFRNCRIIEWADNSGAILVKAGTTNAIDRYVIFDHCLFSNAIHAGSTNTTVAMDLGADIGGVVYLWDSWLTGATDWADDFTLLYALGGMSQVATQNVGGLEKVLA